MVCGPPSETTSYISFTPAMIESSATVSDESGLFQLIDQSTLELQEFPPGSIIILKKNPRFSVPLPLSDHPLFIETEKLIDSLSYTELNILLYRCAAEENDGSKPIGTYELPGYGPLAYSGLQGFYSVVQRIQFKELNQHHPLIQNIKSGDWALKYISDRLERKAFPKLVLLARTLKELASQIQNFNEKIKPRLFVDLVDGLYNASRWTALKRMPLKIRENGEFIQDLAMTSVQLIGMVESTGLCPEKGAESSLSAGLPHFSTHHMRCWGRDIFISLPGLMLRTGRIDDAKRHLLAFASCYYRGLIPNLLDSARRPRYNARDATWWFLNALRIFCETVADGESILEESVPLRFPNGVYVDFDDPTIFSRRRPLKEIVQDILQSHAEGIKFKEWNAGSLLDPVMTEAGFEINIRLDPRTGFIHGGNAHNCGTWMDKMGESTNARNRGVPATPRDGAAIEIIALLYSVLGWLSSSKCPTERSHVVLKDGREFSYKEWHSHLQVNFERYFYIPPSPEDDIHFEIDASLVIHRGIYKDTVGASHRKCDFQLRPNMVVAMSVAPDLFAPQKAKIALEVAEQFLLGPLGLKTLSPLDPDFRPNYDNADDSGDYHVAHGFNYHQGPEWLWPMGCYLKAWNYFLAPDFPEEERICLVLKRVQPHWAHLQASDYAGLAELTNKDGSYCKYSCATQAWSSATLLDALLEILPKDDSYYS